MSSWSPGALENLWQTIFFLNLIIKTSSRLQQQLIAIKNYSKKITIFENSYTILPKGTVQGKRTLLVFSINYICAYSKKKEYIWLKEWPVRIGVDKYNWYKT